MGQLMLYNTELEPDVANTARELEVHMSHTLIEHWKELGRLIGFIKGKQTKGIVTRKPKVIIVVMFYNYNYATDKESRKSVNGLVATLGVTPIMCSS